MLDTIAQFDTWMFLRLNAGAANAVLDWLMPILTESRNWRPFIIGGALSLAIFGGGRGRSVVLVAVILLAITDQLSAHLIKPLVGRPRPCHTVEGVRLLYRCGRTFAFPSSHATNTMAAAVFFGLTYRRWLWSLIGLSVLVSYSRVYLGIHYPLDVAGGWIIGGGVAFLVLWTYRRHIQPFVNRFIIFRANGGTATGS